MCEYVLKRLLCLIAGQSLVLSTLYPLTSNTKLLKEMMNKGALVYLLDIYANSLNATVRQQTAELFAKILSDKLVGPKVRLIMCKFLPPVFMDAMRDSAEASVHMFEGTFYLLSHFMLFNKSNANQCYSWKNAV